jgi:hypothetical protein
MVTTYSIKEAIEELNKLQNSNLSIYKKNKNSVITVYSLWGKREIKLKNLSLVEVLKDDLYEFKQAFRNDIDNEGLKDQIIRIETILYDLGEMPPNKTTFGILFSKKEYPIHIVVKQYALIFT